MPLGVVFRQAVIGTTTATSSRFCYSNLINPIRLRAHKGRADAWRDIHLKTKQVCAQIRKMKSTFWWTLPGTRGGTGCWFCPQAAPIQVTVGYPNTTRLAAMDYRITDAYADPPG